MSTVCNRLEGCPAVPLLVTVTLTEKRLCAPSRIGAEAPAETMAGFAPVQARAMPLAPDARTSAPSRVAGSVGILVIGTPFAASPYPFDRRSKRAVGLPGAWSLGPAGRRWASRSRHKESGPSDENRTHRPGEVF